jgi:hypothetical protein
MTGDDMLWKMRNGTKIRIRQLRDRGYRITKRVD